MPDPHAARPSTIPRRTRGGLDELLGHALMLKAVFCDLDDTFLDAHHEPPACAAAVVDRLQATGVRFAVATGRTPGAVRGLLGTLADRIDLVGRNGMDVVCGGCVLRRHTFERPLVETVLGAVAGSGLPLGLAVFEEQDAYLLDPDPAFARAAIESLRGVADRPLGDGLGDGDVCKVAVVVHDGAEKALRLLEASLGERLDFAPCGPHWIDVLAKGVDKVDGVRAVLARLGAAPHEAAAFGDSMNDLKMMEALPLSVAVANAMPALKAACAFEIGPNTEEAVPSCLARIAALREQAGLRA